MRTDDLISMLARSAVPVDVRRVSQQFSATALCAVLASLIAMLLVLGPRQDWGSDLQDPVFWAKLVFPAAAALAGFAVLRGVGYPGMRPGLGWIGMVLPFAVVWLLGCVVLLQAPAAEREALVLGTSSWKCAVGVVLLSVPALALTFLALRRLAPTGLASAGAVAGFFAGSAGAFAYALYCTEMQLPFVAIWYSLGILVATALGALLGRPVLRW